jgi:hypothetical protein
VNGDDGFIDVPANLFIVSARQHEKREKKLFQEEENAIRNVDKSTSLR